MVAEKFTQGISGENPYWEDDQAVPSLSDHCIRSIVRWLEPFGPLNMFNDDLRCFSFKPGISSRLRGNDRQRFLALLSLTEDIRSIYHAS